MANYSAARLQALRMRSNNKLFDGELSKRNEKNCLIPLDKHLNTIGKIHPTSMILLGDRRPQLAIC